MPITGFVLAGGKSTRMGRDKALLEWRGKTLLNHAIGLLRESVDHVQVVGRYQLPDRMPGLGPLGGIATALEVSSTDANLFLAVDLPHLTKDFLKYLRSRIENSSHPMLACKIESDFPLCLGIRRLLLPEIKRRISANQLSIRGLIEGAAAEIVSQAELSEAGFDKRMFRNINTPEDYQRD
jgi:molybdenum cofactor guanylyltransferase